MKGDSGKDIDWGNAVKFKMHNIETVPDDTFDVKDVEVELEVTVACDSVKETVELNRALQAAKTSGKSFVIATTLPNRDKNNYSAKSIDSAAAILKQLK
jgi:hypothetical protein